MKISTGIEGLDTMLKGGVLKGRNILVSGPAGSGKTTLAVQFAYAGAARLKQKALYVTLEESKEKIIQDMKQFGFDLRKAEKNKRFFLVGGPLAKLNMTMQKVGARVLNLISEIEEIIREENITRVVIDSINTFTMLMEGEEEKRTALATLMNAISELGCTSFIISETEEGSMKLSRNGIEEFVVDGVIVLYTVRQGSRFIPGIAVRKMRGSDHDKEIRALRITKKGVAIYPDETMFGEL